MLNKKLEKAFNDQIALEADSSNIYLAMASWFEVSRIDYSAKFLYQHAEEEKGHMMKIVRYLNENGGHAVIPGLKAPATVYKSILDVFETALGHECKVTKSIHALYELAQSVKDHASANFLRWFVDEQQEEERLFTDIVDKLKMIGVNDSRGVYFADKYVGKIVEKK